MSLSPTDLAILILGGAFAVFGLFIGFSGALAFCLGTVCAGLCAFFCWPLSADYLSSVPLRGLVTVLAALLAFGLVRFIVRKTVHGLLAQPGDAIFGSLLSGLTAAVILVAALYGLRLWGVLTTPSVIVDALARGLAGVF